MWSLVECSDRLPADATALYRVPAWYRTHAGTAHGAWGGVLREKNTHLPPCPTRDAHPPRVACEVHTVAETPICAVSVCASFCTASSAVRSLRVRRVGDDCYRTISFRSLFRVVHHLR